MKYQPNQSWTRRRRARRDSGSAVLACLAILTVTFIAVGATLFETSNRFRTSHQSSRWAQAGQAAEAGAELALMSAQKSSWTADGWSAAPGVPGTNAVTKTFALDAGVTATGPISASVAVDTLSLNGEQWLRIRSRGSAEMAGMARAGIDSRDVMLRKLSLRTDRSSGVAVTSPLATRTVEILAQPASRAPFTRAVLLDKRLVMSGSAYFDSFDSSDPAKSNNGTYTSAKRQFNGDVAMNDASGSVLGDCYIYGDLAYSGTVPMNTTNVQGTISTPFSEPIVPPVAPTWTSFNANPSTINSSTTLTGGTKTSPARYKVSSIALAGSAVLTMASHAAGQESYIEVWVTGSPLPAALSSPSKPACM